MEYRKGPTALLSWGRLEAAGYLWLTIEWLLKHRSRRCPQLTPFLDRGGAPVDCTSPVLNMAAAASGAVGVLGSGAATGLPCALWLSSALWLFSGLKWTFDWLCVQASSSHWFLPSPHTCEQTSRIGQRDWQIWIILCRH